MKGNDHIGGTMIFPFSTFMIMGGRVLFIVLFVGSGHRHHDIIGRFRCEFQALRCIEDVSLQKNTYIENLYRDSMISRKDSERAVYIYKVSMVLFFETCWNYLFGKLQDVWAHHVTPHWNSILFRSTSFKVELAALPESPRDVVGDIRVARFLRFYGGKVPEATGGDGALDFYLQSRSRI